MGRKVKKFNIKDLAKEAGVSISTVSRVLNNHPDVSESLRKKVLAIIEKNNFTPDKATERPFRINVVIGVGDITDYISSILTGIEVAANEANIEISIQRVTGRISLLNNCRIWRSDALIIISGNDLLSQVPEVANAEIPCMLINSKIDYCNVGCINNEFSFTMNQLLNHLHSFGHKKIAFLSASPVTLDSYKKRVAAYKEFMSSIGEKPNKLLIPPYRVAHIEGIGIDKEAGYQSTLQLLFQHPEVTAIACANDELAIGCYKACFDYGKRIPQDISIVGFDDQSFAKYMTPSLTTVKLHLAQAGKLAVKSLKDYLKGKANSLPQLDLPTELIVRNSVARIEEK
ncbi:MAG: LacI family DNA-binding transcriptional regulator [Lentisphaeria bacterium]|nr:LacI family DNA-binding transcriptional regulator [Lentisphaeria bacterium]